MGAKHQWLEPWLCPELPEHAYSTTRLRALPEHAYSRISQLLLQLTRSKRVGKAEGSQFIIHLA